MTIRHSVRGRFARAREVMKELGVESFDSRRFGHLSTGEQRRCLLGRALVHDPLVLVLDEPTSGLDLKACFQYLDLLRAQIRKGKTVLLVTHHLHEIPPEIERVILLKDGKIMAEGKKADVMTAEKIGNLFDRAVTRGSVKRMVPSPARIIRSQHTCFDLPFPKPPFLLTRDMP